PNQFDRGGLELRAQLLGEILASSTEENPRPQPLVTRDQLRNPLVGLRGPPGKDNVHPRGIRLPHRLVGSNDVDYFSVNLEIAIGQIDAQLHFRTQGRGTERLREDPPKADVPYLRQRKLGKVSKLDVKVGDESFGGAFSHLAPYPPPDSLCTGEQ